MIRYFEPPSILPEQINHHHVQYIWIYVIRITIKNILVLKLSPLKIIVGE